MRIFDCTTKIIIMMTLMIFVVSIANAQSGNRNTLISDKSQEIKGETYAVTNVHGDGYTRIFLRDIPYAIKISSETVFETESRILPVVDPLNPKVLEGKPVRIVIKHISGKGIFANKITVLQPEELVEIKRLRELAKKKIRLNKDRQR